MIKTTSAFLALLALGACASEIGYHTGSLSAANEQHGDAVRQNIAAQTVNPAGSSADVTASGARVSKAVQAYTADKVEKPGSAGTTSVGSQGGGQPAAK
jgi:hypothetical protein